MKYRMHVKGRGIIEGTMAEGPAPGLVHIVGGARVVFHLWDLEHGFATEEQIRDLYPRWPGTTVPLGRWSWRRLFGETDRFVLDSEWRLPDRPVDVIVPVCDIKWAKEIQ